MSKTGKSFDLSKNKSDNDLTKVEPLKKEVNDSQNNKPQNDKKNQYNDEQKKILIEKFDKEIIKYAEFVSDDKLIELEKSSIKQWEEDLEEIPFESLYNEKFNDTCFIRPGLLFKKDNSLYKGSWNIQGKKEGFGIFMDSKGNKYAGEWKDDKFNGKGRLFSINGDVYEGNFKKGVIEGNGMFLSKTMGYKYLGEFKNHKFHGKGKLIYDNKIIYEGNFVEGYKEGEGKIIFSNGAIYEGNFFKNHFNGKGKFNFNDGRIYKGDWKNNEMDGRGVFCWGNGCKYNGQYKKNRRDGDGVYTFGCNLYDGYWINGLPHGEGILLINGLKIVANFRYGKILEMKYGKGVNKELTQKISISVDSIVINKSLDYNYRGTERTEIDSKNYKKSNTSDFVNLSVKKEKKKENKNNNNNKYRNHIKLHKNKSNEKEKKEIKKKKDNGKRKISKK